MKTAFDKLMAGLGEVEDYLAGERRGFKVHVPDEVDVKAIRSRLGLTQARFSDAFGFSLDAVKHWESHRRQPEASARVLLMVIENDPAAVIAALHPDLVERSGTRSRTYARAKQYIRRTGKGRSARANARATG